MSAEASREIPLLSDQQVATLFELAGIDVPPAIQQRVWAEARDLKRCAARLHDLDRGALAAMLGKG